MLLSVIVFWTVCGVLTHGISFAFLQRNYPTLADDNYREDLLFSVVAGLSGPIGLMAAIGVFDFAKYGLKFK